MDTERLWQTVLGEIEVGMSPANFQTWFRATGLSSYDEEKGLAVVRVPNDFTRNWLEKRYQKEIHKSLAKHLPKVVVVTYVVGSRKPVEAPNETLVQLMAEPLEVAPEPAPTTNLGLNPKLTFGSFVVGENSRLCHAAAESVAHNPGAAYNPLFIYGDSGLGKTHLLQAIGNEILEKTPKAKVVYVTSERFTNEMVEAIRNKEMREFKEKYRRVDCLLIDDVQFLSAKEQTQEEFFHTFNALHSAGKQIVLTSDRPPKAIASLEERLRSRFEWGMIADISTPSYETRLAILQMKLSAMGKVVDNEVLEYIAKTVKNNVRELEGALNRVCAYADLSATHLTVEEAKSLLGGVLVAPGRRVVKPSEIVRAVVGYYEVRKDQLEGRVRTKEIVIPRQVLIYLLREEIDMPYKQIGAELGGRDHSTIMHDYNKIRELVLTNDSLETDIREIKNRLYAVD